MKSSLLLIQLSFLFFVRRKILIFSLISPKLKWAGSRGRLFSTTVFLAALQKIPGVQMIVVLRQRLIYVVVTRPILVRVTWLTTRRFVFLGLSRKFVMVISPPRVKMVKII